MGTDSWGRGLSSLPFRCSCVLPLPARPLGILGTVPAEADAGVLFKDVEDAVTQRGRGGDTGGSVRAEAG